MKTFIVAEIGLNHNGKMNTAKKLIRIAAEAGVDAVKFQTYWNIPEYRHLGFTKFQWPVIFYYCKLYDLKWFSTPFDLEAVSFLDSQGMDTWKLPSNAIVLNDPLMLNAIQNAKSRKQTIISTGISNNDKISDLISLFDDKLVTLLHCVSKYPTPIADLNLDRIKQLRERFKIPVGLSDHSLSVFTAPIRAIEYGATVIEKHITLDRNADGPDHRASLEPTELKTMVGCIRIYEELHT